MRRVSRVGLRNLALSRRRFLVGHFGDAFAFVCNDRHYVNVDGQEVHSLSW